MDAELLRHLRQPISAALRPALGWASLPGPFDALGIGHGRSQRGTEVRLGLQSHRSCDICDFPMAPEVGAEQRQSEPIGAASRSIQEPATDKPAKQFADVGDVASDDAQISRGGGRAPRRLRRLRRWLVDEMVIASPLLE
jgi:hypothetical protein